jgi:hypothetical protein
MVGMAQSVENEEKKIFRRTGGSGPISSSARTNA